MGEEEIPRYDGAAEIWLKKADKLIIDNKENGAKIFYSKITDEEINKHISPKYINEAKLMLKEYYFED